jgi:hypothetical protein
MRKWIGWFLPVTTVLTVCSIAGLGLAAGDPSTAGSTAFCNGSIAAGSGGGGSKFSPANNIAPSQTVFSTDFAVAAVGGLRNVGSGVINLAGVSGPVTKALLYWHGPTNSADTNVNAAIAVNGNGYVGKHIGFSFDNCWGYDNSQAYVLDLTSLVQSVGNGAYALTGLKADISSVDGGANTNGASLIVFFDDGNSANDRDVVIFHGNDSNVPNVYDNDGWNVSLSNINYTAGTASLHLHVADGQYDTNGVGYIDDSLVLNGVAIEPLGPIFSGTTVPSANNGPLDNGNLWDIKSYDVTSFLSPGPNSLTLTTGLFQDCLGLIVALVDLPAGAGPNVCNPGFDPPPNWPYFCDYFSVDAQFMSENLPYPIMPGDIIHATDPQGVVCGLTVVDPDSFGVYLIHVLGDDPDTPGDEGAMQGDQITLWLNCECPVTPPQTWMNFGSFEYDALWDCEGCDSLCGYVYNAECFTKSTCEIDSVIVELWSSYPDGILIATTITDEFGHFCFNVEDGYEYDVRFYKRGWCTDVVEDWQCADGTLNVGLIPLYFEPLPNWPFFCDYFSDSAKYLGFPIQPGDVVHATDPQGVICGIWWVTAEGEYLVHVLGDDPNTLEDEGAEPGDVVKLWLNCDCPELVQDAWVNFGSFRFDVDWDCRFDELCCVLCEGWNMWSHNLIVPDYAREAVLATIDLNYDAVRSGLCDYGSISWFAGRPINDLEDVTPWFGYDIHMLAEDTVCLQGQFADPATPIYLCEGWNYIPYLPTAMDDLGHALGSLDGNYSHIFTMYCGYGVASWHEAREPQNNDLVCMEPCKGYWINMKSEDTLIYPSDDYGCLRQAKLSGNSPSRRVTPTPMVADYYAANSTLNNGDLISVRTSSGALIGECNVGADGAFLVHVYGDVPQTPEVEGAVHGEELVFEVNGMAAAASEGIVWTDRDNRAIELTVTGANPLPTEYTLLQNYPNPFNAGTVMPFVLKNASEWTLTVYNIMGQTVQTFSGHGDGLVRVTWNGRDQNGAAVPSGVYFYRVTTPEWQATRKMTILK